MRFVPHNNFIRWNGEQYRDSLPNPGTIPWPNGVGDFVKGREDARFSRARREAPLTGRMWRRAKGERMEQEWVEGGEAGRGEGGRGVRGVRGEEEEREGGHLAIKNTY